MPQSPIPAQSYSREPSKNFTAQLSDKLGNVWAGRGPGTTFYVNETIGDDSNSGSWAMPFATLTAALGACTANNGDSVCFIGSIHVTATVAWNKNGVDLIGLLAPSINGRSRISSTGATAFSPLVDVTGVGCRFINLGTFHGGFTGATGSQVCWADDGGRNYYKRCAFLGGGDATTAALAGMRSLTIGGAGENLFEDCTYGLDTIERITDANATLEVINGSARNVLRRGQFQAYNGLAGNVHILVQANGMDRYLLLDDITLHNFGGTAMSAAIINDGGSPGGDVILTPSCSSVGATAIATTGNVYVSGAVPTGATSSLAALAT